VDNKSQTFTGLLGLVLGGAGVARPFIVPEKGPFWADAKIVEDFQQYCRKSSTILRTDRCELAAAWPRVVS
jgi:hypothetical protein